MTETRQVKELLSRDQIARRVQELGAQIAADYQGKELVLVGVLKGSFLFLADLARAIPGTDVLVDFLGLASYGDATRSSGVVQITADLTKPIEGKHVLVVEDIVDTGLTMEYLLDNLKTRHPASVKLCSLLHKPSRSVKQIPIDYLGFTIPDLFVIGYGLDYAQRYRNLPYIGVLE
ncbi:MAG: hypoxanthine phosphoribosyltransferase [Myxococcales bacterium]|nr:hypoxanthine phosphoribosyltransferase [Myxococcales bacterium]